MKLEDIVEKKIELNTQEIFILKKSELRKIHNIREVEEFENMGKSIVPMFEHDIKYVLERDELMIAVYKYPSVKHIYTWIPYLLYEYHGEIYRMHRENYQCNSCNNIYSVGNAAQPSLFDTIAMSEYQDVMNRVKKFPKANCPYCGEVISRFWAIWADDKKQN